ncbi:hypothetical protein MPER_00897 [Moniliophthora perniciosa FA553]|nr:hypothetical protein MPER_00897 [Moniliophthora perniciosa FA553]
MEGDELIRMAPYLLPLCTRVWLKAIRSMHWSWPKWCAILDEVLNVPKYASHFMDIIQELDAGKNIIHFGIRYLNHIAKDIREMDERGLSAFRNLIILFTVCFSTGTFLNVPFLQNGGAAVTVRALRALCSSRKVVKHVSSSSPDFTKLMILTACTTTFLRDSLSGTLGIPDALGAGLLSIMIKAERFHSYEFDHDSPMTSFDLDYTVWSSFVSLLNQISLFVVYPSVLRHIAKAAKSGLAFGPRTVKELQISWEKCKQRALEMQAVYSSVKQTGLLCCFLDVCVAFQFSEIRMLTLLVDN